LQVALDLADVGDPVERGQVGLVVVRDGLRCRSGACPASTAVQEGGLPEVLARVLADGDLALEDRFTVGHRTDAARLLVLVFEPFVENGECSHEKKRLSRGFARVGGSRFSRPVRTVLPVLDPAWIAPW